MSEQILRRDPRVEWILRNRLHPLHAEYALAPAEVRGPSGLLRKNPHAVGFMGPNGIKRIDRLAGNGPAGGAVRGSGKGAAQAPQLPKVTIDTPDYHLVVVPDLVGGRLSGHDRDLLGQARKLVREHGGASGGEGAVVAVLFGECRESQHSLGAAGIDRVVRFDDKAFEGYCPEQELTALLAVERGFAPRHWLFPDSVQGGGERGRRLAARIAERPATQAWLVDKDSTVCRGAGESLDITRSTPRLLLLAAECAEPVDDALYEARDETVKSAAQVRPQLQDRGPVAVDPSAVPLAEAEFILSAGNGIHNWDQFHRTAELLGATEGASRVAVDDGHMPRFRQVGATGTWVTARVYLAVGISGAIQHMQGIGQCDKVVAINTDAGCDMVKRADLSVIGDSEAILSELVKLAENYRVGGAEDAA